MLVCGSLSAAESNDNKTPAAKTDTAKPSSADPATDTKNLEAMQPGPEHEQLDQRLVGNWKVHCSLWMKPDASAMTSSGESNCKAILDGRFFRSDFSGTFQEKEYKGLSLIGYDRLTKKYVQTWCDSMSTTLVCLTGTSTDNGKTITFEGEIMCPHLGKSSIREIQRHDSDNRFTIVMYQKPENGSEFKSMELVYSRQ
jgi:hypothetical protein